MIGIRNFCMLLLFMHSVHSLSLKKEEAVLIPQALPPYDDCDPSTIPVMDNFDIKRFSGAWYELAKSASGFIEVNDGMWKILSANDSTTFLFSGRDSNGHCIRPIKGKIRQSDQPPGMINLHYQTYSTYVEENVRVLFTDYTSIAVIYLCMHHVHSEKQVCHAAGLMGSVWTRHPHVERSVYDTALRYLEMACVHSSVLILRNQIGPCKVDDLGFQIDEFPAPDYCYQPLDIGYCRGSIQRYFYDPKEKSCKLFSYSGCGGNRNNFMSLPECQENCLSTSLKEPVCQSEAKCALHCSPCCTENRNGCIECNCEHIIVDPPLNCVKSPANCQRDCEVEEFYPGCYICSCHGDVNEPFLDMPECLEVKVEGDCNSEIVRFYYNALTKECEKFIYTGCKGNRNNFETMGECMQRCQDSITMESVTEDNSSPTFMYFNGWTASVLLLFTIFV